MTVEPTSATFLAEMERLWAKLAELLADDDPAYRNRPPTGKWSVQENLQHLVFAEQAHFRRYLAEPPAMSTWAPRNATKGTQFLAASINEVFAEWARTHEATKTLAGHDDPRLVDRLDRHVKHLRAHVKVIERLLKQRAKVEG